MSPLLIAFLATGAIILIVLIIRLLATFAVYAAERWGEPYAWALLIVFSGTALKPVF